MRAVGRAVPPALSRVFRPAFRRLAFLLSLSTAEGRCLMGFGLCGGKEKSTAKGGEKALLRVSVRGRRGAAAEGAQGRKRTVRRDGGTCGRGRGRARGRAAGEDDRREDARMRRRSAGAACAETARRAARCCAPGPNGGRTVFADAHARRGQARADGLPHGAGSADVRGGPRAAVLARYHPVFARQRSPGLTEIYDVRRGGTSDTGRPNHDRLVT